MAACAKHWIADGGTQYGTGTDLFSWTGAPTGVLDQGDSHSYTHLHVHIGDSRLDEATLRP